MVFRMSPLLRASRPTRAESHRKITKIDPLGDPKSTQERPKSSFGALFEPLRSTKSIEESSSSDLGATWSVEKACRSDWRGDLGRSWLARGRPDARTQFGAPKPGRVTTLLIYIYIYILYIYILYIILYYTI